MRQGPENSNRQQQPLNRDQCDSLSYERMVTPESRSLPIEKSRCSVELSTLGRSEFVEAMSTETTLHTYVVDTNRELLAGIRNNLLRSDEDFYEIIDLSTGNVLFELNEALSAKTVFSDNIKTMLIEDIATEVHRFAELVSKTKLQCRLILQRPTMYNELLSLGPSKHRENLISSALRADKERMAFHRDRYSISLLKVYAGEPTLAIDSNPTTLQWEKALASLWNTAGVTKEYSPALIQQYCLEGTAEKMFAALESYLRELRQVQMEQVPRLLSSYTNMFSFLEGSTNVYFGRNVSQGGLDKSLLHAQPVPLLNRSDYSRFVVSLEAPDSENWDLNRQFDFID